MNEMKKHKIDILQEARQVFETEVKALNLVQEDLGTSFVQIVNTIVQCHGKVVVTGVGKSGHIAEKMAATFSSLGTPSFFVHSTEALHGDLGVIEAKDILILISYSGESEELLRLLPSIKQIGVQTIAISGNRNSQLVKNCDLAHVFPSFEEACHMNIAPTSSTTAVLVLGDAIAVTAAKIYGFNKSNFGLIHPAGLLGKKLLLKAESIMDGLDNCASVQKDSNLSDAIAAISKYGHGLIVVENEASEVIGVVSDGDIRRLLVKKENIYAFTVEEIMSQHPLCIAGDALAVEAADMLRKRGVFAAPVIDENRQFIGIITLQNLLQIGLGF